ncbi:hypothetical protein HD806DRAFT_532308 [Xylariaceae sp. AK1471]|nr:hypothetical protein HD806DRAFT_532308 [Xylariaceae sp. AK1471]
MPQKERRFKFNGTNNDYIEFLETKVESLEKTIEYLQHQQSSNPHPQKRVVQPNRSTFISQQPHPRKRVVQPNRGAFISQHPQAQKRLAGQDLGNDFASRVNVVVSNFLASIPTLHSQWQEKREKTSLATPKQVIKAFHILTRLSSSIDSTMTWSRRSSNPSTIEILNDYCTFACHLNQIAEQQTQLSRYATLLFFGICCVTREAGVVSVDCVDNLVKAYFGSDYTSRYCLRLRMASKWCAQLMEKLEALIGHRGPEVLLLYGLDIAMYQKMSESPTCVDRIVEQITKKMDFLHSDAIGEPVVSFSMPFMLAFIGLDLQCVNKALGTTLSVEDYVSRARMVEDLTSYNYSGQQSTAALGINHESDKLAMLIQAAQSSSPDGNGRGLIAEASITEFTNSEGNNEEWTRLIDWGNNTSEMDVVLAGDSSTGAL